MIEEGEELILKVDTNQILNDILGYLGITEEFDQEHIDEKCNELSKIKSEKELKQKFPRLYPVYLQEKNVYKIFHNQFAQYGVNASTLINKSSSFGKEDIESKYYLIDSLKIRNVNYFCKLYSSIIKEIASNFFKIDEYYKNRLLKINNDLIYISNPKKI